MPNLKATIAMLCIFIMSLVCVDHYIIPKFVKEKDISTHKELPEFRVIPSLNDSEFSASEHVLNGEVLIPGGGKIILSEKNVLPGISLQPKIVIPKEHP